MLSVVFLHVLPVLRFAPDTGYIFFEAQDVCCLFAHVGALDIPKNAIDLKVAHLASASGRFMSLYSILSYCYIFLFNSSCNCRLSNCSFSMAFLRNAANSS